MKHSILDIATYILTPEDSALSLYTPNIARFSSPSGFALYPFLKTVFWMAASGVIAFGISSLW